MNYNFILVHLQPFPTINRQYRNEQQKAILKIIDIYQEINELIESAKNEDRQAQRVLYNKFSPKMLSVCRQYINDIYSAEDVMVTAFMKVFTHLQNYEQRGSFEGWIRRITVNECISHIRANKRFKYTEEHNDEMIGLESADSELHEEDIQTIIDQLPSGCKIVFNLYEIEGYKHAEIGQMLSISEGTSKSQLAYARRRLQNLVLQNNKVNHG